MCNFVHLYINHDGYVVKCIECNRYKIAFGTAMIILEHAEYTRLLRACMLSLATAEVTVDETIKSIFVPTSHAGISLILSYAELKNFAAILDAADNENQALSMIKLFRKN